MNYEKNYTDYAAYVKTLNRKKGEGTYYEEHHIIPKCMGGSNDPGNKVLLTAREHFLAHYLLMKIYKTYKITYAFICMGRKMQAPRMGGLRYCNSRLYEKIKKETKFIQSEEHKAKLKKLMTGRTLSKETREKIAEAHRGLKHSEEWKKNHSEQLKGHVITEEQKLKISIANKGKRTGMKMPPKSEAYKKAASERAKAQWARRKQEGHTTLGDKKEEIENG